MPYHEDDDLAPEAVAEIRAAKAARANPSSDPTSGKTVDQTVWYLSHPIAPDEHMTMQENIDDTKEWVKLFWENGVRVIAPYLTIIEVLSDEEQYRVPGLEADVALCRKMGRLIAVGHRFSSGMKHEYDGTMKCLTGGVFLNYIGWTRQQVQGLLNVAPDMFL